MFKAIRVPGDPEAREEWLGAPYTQGLRNQLVADRDSAFKTLYNAALQSDDPAVLRAAATVSHLMTILALTKDDNGG